MAQAITAIATSLVGSFTQGFTGTTVASYAGAGTTTVSSGGIAGGLAAATSSAALTDALVAGASTYVAGQIGQALREDPSSSDLATEGANRLQMVRQSAAPRVNVYGKVKKSGPMILAETTGKDNKFLHLIIYLSEGPIESLESIFLNEDKVDLSGTGEATTLTANGKYDGKFQARWHNGADSQTADSTIQNRIKPWTSSHRLRGIAYLYTRLEFDRQVFPGGIPNVSAVIKGRNNVTDPRDDTDKYTTNPALIINDYIQDNKIGLNADSSEVDTDTVKTAANTCEETVNGANRYTANGVVDSSKTPQEILSNLTASMAGRVFYSEGKYHVQAGEWTSPVKELTDDDFADTFTVQTKRSKQELFNAIKGTYISPNNNWQVTDFPPITDSTAKSNDNGERIWKNIQLEFTQTAEEAQRIARIMKNKVRNQVNFSAMFQLTALELQVGDTVEITHSRFGWSKKTFRVVEQRIRLLTDENGTIRPAVELRFHEEDSSVFSTQSETSESISNPVLELTA